MSIVIRRRGLMAGAAAGLVAGRSRAAVIAPPGPSLSSPHGLMTGAPSINGLGDSMIANGCASGPSIAAYLARSIIAAANAYLGNMLRFDISATGGGYTGNIGGIFKYQIRSGGTGYSVGNTITCTATGLSGALGTVDQVSPTGAIMHVTPTTQGSGATGGVTAVTIAQGSGATLGTGAVIDGVLGGTGTFGVYGQTSSQIIARVPDVLAAGLDFVPLMMGANDVSNAYAAATVVANYDAACQALVAGGARVLLIPPPPHTYASASYPYTAQKLAILNAIHSDVRKYGRGQRIVNSMGLKAVHLVDVTNSIQNNTSPYGDWPAANTGDGLHGDSLWADVVGKARAQVIQAVAPSTVNGWSASPADTYDATNNPGGDVMIVPGSSPAQRIGTFMASGGSIGSYSGSGSVAMSGTIGNKWTLLGSGAASAAGTVVASIVARGDGVSGYAQRLAISLTAGGTQETVRLLLTMANSTYGLNAGVDSLIAAMDQVFATGVSGLVGIQIYWQDTTGFYAYGMQWGSNDSLPGGSLIYPPRQTPAALLPAGGTSTTINISLTFNASAASAGSPVGGTFDIANASLRKQGLV
jgi:lysophospholipase L1-like esterase